MDAMTLQPAAGAHGEFTGLLLIRAYHHQKGDTARTRCWCPTRPTAPTRPAPAMAGFTVGNIPSTPDGLVNLDALRAACGPTRRR